MKDKFPMSEQSPYALQWKDEAPEKILMDGGVDFWSNLLQNNLDPKRTQEFSRILLLTKIYKEWILEKNGNI